MPGKVEDIERAFQCAGNQHPDLFNDVRLWKKRGKSEQQNQRDQKFVFKQIFHGNSRLIM
jgi:hypothetical protein